MGNRARRELEGQAMLRAMLAHPPRERVLPRCDRCGGVAVIGAYAWPDNHYFCDAHRAETDGIFGGVSDP